MSTYCMVVNFDGKPVDKALVDKILANMRIAEPDYVNMYIDGNMGCGCNGIYNTPESLNEVLPYEIENCVVIYSGILTDRELLADKLGFKWREVKNQTDSFFIYQAYKKWGESGVSHLRGFFTFCIWNKDTKSVFAAPCQLGPYVQYYVHIGSMFILVSMISGIKNSNITRLGLNESMLVRFAYISPLDGDQTFYDPIKKVCPGNSISIRKNILISKTYFEIESLCEPIRFSKTEDYYDAFEEIFNKSVMDLSRTAFPLATHLSGGLDSSTITAVLAKNLSVLSDRRVHAIGATPQLFAGRSFENKIYSDLKHMRLVTRNYLNIDLRIVSNWDPCFFRICNDVSKHSDMPLLSACNAGWLFETINSAKKLNCRVILDGDYGNLTFSYHGVTKFRKYGRLLKTYFNSSSYPSGAGYFLFDYILKYWRNRYYNSVNFSVYGNDYQWLDETSRRIAAIKLSFYLQAGVLGLFQSQYKVSVFSPALSFDIVKYSLGIPGRVFIGPKGFGRSLVREAFKDYLPKRVLLRKDKGAQNPTWYLDLHKTLAQFNFKGLNVFFDSNKLESVASDFLPGIQSVEKASPAMKEKFGLKYRYGLYRALHLTQWINNAMSFYMS